MSGALRDCRMLIGGEWVDAASGERFDTINGAGAPALRSSGGGCCAGWRS